MFKLDVDGSGKVPSAAGEACRASRAARYRLAKAELWRAVRARWMLGGVLAAVTLAVLAPRLGAPGGNYCMRAARGVHGEPAAGLRVLQRGPAPARALAAGAAAAAGAVRGARAPRGARAGRRAAGRAHGRRGLPDRQGGDAVVVRRRLRVAVAGAERARRGAGGGGARVRRFAARHAAAHRSALRARDDAVGAGRGEHAGHDGGPVRGRRAAGAGPARRRAAPAARRAAGGAAAAVRRVLRAPVRRGGHPVPRGRAGGAGAGGVLRGELGGVVRAVRARRPAVGGGRALRGAVRAAALAGHARVHGVCGAGHVPAAGRVRGAGAGRAAGGAGAGAPRGPGSGGPGSGGPGPGGPGPGRHRRAAHARPSLAPSSDLTLLASDVVRHLLAWTDHDNQVSLECRSEMAISMRDASRVRPERGAGDERRMKQRITWCRALLVIDRLPMILIT